MSDMVKEEKGGKTSSTRVNATLLIWIGIIMGAITWGISLFHPLGNTKACLEIIAFFLGSGTITNVAAHIRRRNTKC